MKKTQTDTVIANITHTQKMLQNLLNELERSALMSPHERAAWGATYLVLGTLLQPVFEMQLQRIPSEARYVGGEILVPLLRELERFIVLEPAMANLQLLPLKIPEGGMKLLTALKVQDIKFKARSLNTALNKWRLEILRVKRITPNKSSVKPKRGRKSVSWEQRKIDVKLLENWQEYKRELLDDETASYESFAGWHNSKSDDIVTAKEVGLRLKKIRQWLREQFAGDAYRLDFPTADLPITEQPRIRELYLQIERENSPLL